MQNEQPQHKRIAILGSTGSIGTQAIEVIRSKPDLFQVEVLTANNNAELLIQQAREFQPNSVVIANEALYPLVKEALKDEYIKVYAGSAAVAQIVETDSIDLVLAALVGYSGVLPTINALKAGKHIALANKETLVVAGKIITELAIANKRSILPVDSEHSAIFQCLVGEVEYGNNIEKIFLTASGGPFRTWAHSDIQSAGPEQALRHPNWSMGAKVTIDSASLMNKGLEAIEARWLFSIKPSQIEVVVHPQSIVHSAVQFADGSVKAQMGLPDMKLPIQYALGFPQRLQSDFPRFSFFDYPQLTFERPDLQRFPNLALAFAAMEQCGNMPCIMNAANEIAVGAFLHKKITFGGMTSLIDKTMQAMSFIAAPTYEELVATDAESRKFAASLL